MLNNEKVYKEMLNDFYAKVLTRAFGYTLSKSAVEEISREIGKRVAKNRSFGNHSVYVISKVLVNCGNLDLHISELSPEELPEDINWGYKATVFERNFYAGNYTTDDMFKIGIKIWDDYHNVVKIALRHE